MSLTEAEQAERRAYLGGTDAAALAGVNPPRWAQPIDVYNEKLGLAPPRTGTGMTGMGQLLEPVVAGLFTEATGIGLRRPARRISSRTYPWAGGHIDRWAADGAVFEAKWSMRRDEWGEGMRAATPEAPVVILSPGHEGYEAPRVPARYMVQVQHYLAVSGRELGYLAVLLGYADFRWYPIWRDEQAIGLLMELEERFWRDNVLARVPPEPDGSEAYGRHLRTLYATDDGTEAVATPEQQALIAAYRDARRAKEAAARDEAEVAQRIMDSMGSTTKLVADGATVSWPATKPRLRTDWEALAIHLLQLARLPATVANAIGAGHDGWEWPTTKKGQAKLVRKAAVAMEHASEEPGTRPFQVTFTSDEEA